MPDSSVQNGRRPFVFFAYFDESQTKKNPPKWFVLAAVLLKDHAFDTLELLSSIIADDLIPEEKLSQFTEFHACELYGGHQVFSGIDPDKRYSAIHQLLDAITNVGCVVFYGAVDIRTHERSKYGSAPVVDVAFRMCLEQMQKFLSKQHLSSIYAAQFDFGEKALVIFDEPSDRETKGTLQKTFRSLRGRGVTPLSIGAPQLAMYDDMYFGDSRFSIGIQIADLCAYFIARHLDGDAVTEHFYEKIRPRIVSGKQDPASTEVR